MPSGDRKLSTSEIERANRSQGPARSIVVVLDGLRSRHNVGSIFRTADSFGIARIDLCGNTPCPPHREIEKTALGATATVPWEYHEHTTERLMQLKEEGFTIFAVEQTLGAIALRDVVLPTGPLALVFGNELSGVGDEVIGICDACMYIPQFGSKHSLNVSVCAGVVLWWLNGV